MFFGKTTFAEDSFASQGIKDVSVSVTGQSLSTAIGNETAFSNVVATPTGIAVSSTQASVTIFLPDVTATPSGVSIAVQNIGSYSVSAGGEITTIVGSESLLNTSVGTSTVRTDVINQPSGIALTTAQGTATQSSAVVAQPTGIAMTTARGSISFTSDLIVDLTGNGQSLSTAIGTETFRGDVTVTPTGIAMTSAQGNAAGVPVTIASPNGINLTVSVRTPGVLAWSPVVPGTTNSWTPVDDSNTNTWTEVDDREVA